MHKVDFQKIKAVIFDLDGLIVRSEDLSFRSWREILLSYGSDMDPLEYRNLIGVDLQESAQYVIHKAGIQLSVEEVLKQRLKIMLVMIDQGVPMVSGISTLIKELSGFHYPMALASNSRKEYVERILKNTGLRSFFKCVMSSDLVTKSKPAPDVYLAAARCLGIPPEFCLAFEDSPTGMESALNAGMTCIVIANPNLLDADFSPAHARFNSIAGFMEDFRKEFVLQ